MTRASAQATGTVIKPPAMHTLPNCDPFVEFWISMAPQDGAPGKKAFCNWYIVRLFGAGMKKAVSIDVGDIIHVEGHADIHLYVTPAGATKANLVILSTSFTKSPTP